MKKNITPIKIIPFLWPLILLFIQEVYPDYTRYFLYLSIPIITVLAIINLIKQKKEDKLNGTKNFRQSIYRMLIIAAILGVFFFVTEQNHI
nr:hypothetical protein [uncultured Flavobacterium sp.]